MDDLLNPIAELREATTHQAAIHLPNKFTARYLASFQFKAKTLIDIGVAHGTPELYNLFSDRKLLLIDPIPGTAKLLAAKFGGKLDYQFIEAAVGAAKGVATINVMGSKGGKTGILARTQLTNEEVIRQHTVQVTTLDDLLADVPVPQPFGLKIDTEGYELEVLKGARKTLENTEFVIAEVSVKKRFVNSYRFSEVVSFLGSQNFELIDILNFRPRTQRFYDCLFMRYDNRIFG